MKEEEENLETFFGMKMDLIYIYSLTDTTASHGVHSVIKNFFCNEVYAVLLFVADMKIISTAVIDHTRIIINELEQLYAKDTSKLVILLMHYPSNIKSETCYPAIFLHGWDQSYIDSVGVAKTIGNINIVSWLTRCCFESSHPAHNSADPIITKDTFLLWIEELLPTIAACIKIEHLSDWPPTLKTMSDSVDIWRTFLLEMEFANVLVERFLAYWTPAEMIDVSNRASMISRTASIGITGIIEAEFHQVFVDFLLYTLSHINKHHGLHVIFLKDDEFQEQTKKLFSCMLSLIPLPENLQQFKVAVLKYEKNKRSGKTSRTKAFSFPFFRLIFHVIESVLNVAVNNYHDNCKQKKAEPQNRSDQITAAFHHSSMISDVIKLMLPELEKEV